MINADKILSEPRRNVVLTVLNYIIQYRFTYGLKCFFKKIHLNLPQ